MWTLLTVLVLLDTEFQTTDAVFKNNDSISCIKWQAGDDNFSNIIILPIIIHILLLEKIGLHLLQRNNCLFTCVCFECICSLPRTPEIGKFEDQVKLFRVIYSLSVRFNHMCSV